MHCSGALMHCTRTAARERASHCRFHGVLLATLHSFADDGPLADTNRNWAAAFLIQGSGQPRAVEDEQWLWNRLFVGMGGYSAFDGPRPVLPTMSNSHSSSRRSQFRGQYDTRF